MVRVLWQDPNARDSLGVVQIPTAELEALGIARAVKKATPLWQGVGAGIQ